jgi:hypothetical protein
LTVVIGISSKLPGYYLLLVQGVRSVEKGSVSKGDGATRDATALMNSIRTAEADQYLFIIILPPESSQYLFNWSRFPLHSVISSPPSYPFRPLLISFTTFGRSYPLILSSQYQAKVFTSSPLITVIGSFSLSSLFLA